MASADKIYICGVATDICVKAAVRGFLASRYDVTIILDAVAGIDPVASEGVLKQDGVKLITTDEFIEELMKDDELC